MSELLRAEGLQAGFDGPVLRGVDLVLHEGEGVALLGPSGAGKTLLARALLGLLPPDAWWRGRVLWRGADPAAAPGGWTAVRGAGATWLPQEALGALNPVLTVGEQIAEAARQHQGLDRAAARRHAAALLAELQLREPEALLDAWPHQLSGGMRQRALLAAALACGPRLLIADEPTASLDAPVQRDLLALLDRARRARGLALLFITHDRDLVPLVAERCLELRDGRVVDGPAASAPAAVARVRERLDPMAPPPAATPVLTARGLVVRHGGARGPAAVGGVDLDLWPGRVLALVGGSGAGKSSLARALAGHLRPAAGTVTVGHPGAPGGAGPAGGRAGRLARRRVQLLFQDAGASLDPRQRVGAALREAAGSDDPALPGRLLAEVGLTADLATRHPHALSGGQRQRVALARCLAAAPTVLIADEPTSALDAAVRAVVLGLLARVTAARSLALLMITHDLDTAAAFGDDVAVMLGGHLVERVPADACSQLRHPHARRLLACRPSALSLLPDWRPRLGAAPTPSVPGTGKGCPLAGACPLQNASCFKELPPLLPLSPGHWLRCPPASELPSPQFIDTL
jgi:peptide/nickel transport system ATP-binding protein